MIFQLRLEEEDVVVLDRRKVVVVEVAVVVAVAEALGKVYRIINHLAYYLKHTDAYTTSFICSSTQVVQLQVVVEVVYKRISFFTLTNETTIFNFKTSYKLYSISSS